MGLFNRSKPSFDKIDFEDMGESVPPIKPYSDSRSIGDDYDSKTQKLEHEIAALKQKIEKHTNDLDLTDYDANDPIRDKPRQPVIKPKPLKDYSDTPPQPKQQVRQPEYSRRGDVGHKEKVDSTLQSWSSDDDIGSELSEEDFDSDESFENQQQNQQGQQSINNKSTASSNPPVVRQPQTTPQAAQQARQQSTTQSTQQSTPQQVQQSSPPKEVIKIVKELPTEPVRIVRGEDGTIIRLITIEEALELVLAVFSGKD